jgi:dTDP-4-dehydrorhamnose 3,5-epimerase-like enzyme
MAHEILKPAFERNDQRGLFRELTNDGQWESLLMGEMQPGVIIGNHYHERTLIYFYLLSGSVNVRTIHIQTGERDAFALEPNQAVILETNESHAITFCEPSTFVMMKSLRYDPANPDTIHYEVPE